MADIPDETFVFIKNEHTRRGLSLREKWSRIAFHLLAIWCMSVKRKIQVIPMLKAMFNELGLEEGCADVFINYPNMVKKLTPAEKKGPNGVKMGTESLGKGKKSNTASIQSNCSSMHPLHPIGENGEEIDMEEQVPELVDINNNEISSTRDNQEGTTTENENENGNSRHTHTIILKKNMKNLQK